MEKIDLNSNAQSWELKLVCKNNKYLNKIVKRIIKYGFIDFQVSLIEGASNSEGIFEGSYLVVLSSCWLNNLKRISIDFNKIEEDLK